MTQIDIPTRPREQIVRNVSVLGDVVVTPLADPAAPSITNTGTPGATTYSYKIVAISEGDQETAASAAGSTSTGAATLGIADYNAIQWRPIEGAKAYDIYRTVGGSSQGKIVRLLDPQVAFNDTGFPGDSSVAPSSNSTGVLKGNTTMQNLLSYFGNVLLQDGGLAIDATPEDFKTTTDVIVRIGGIQKAVAAGAWSFTAAHPVTASKFGDILVQTDGLTITTKITGATQTTSMAYESAALAEAALPAPDAGHVVVGHIPIAADGTGWVANTDDMTDGGDLTTAQFIDADVASLPSVP